MNISLTDDLKEFVEQQVREHAFASTSEYIRSTLRRERDSARLRATIIDGAADPCSSMDDAYFASLRTDLAGMVDG